MQEVLLAQEIVLYCGNKTLAWKAFNFAAMSHLRDLSLNEDRSGSEDDSNSRGSSASHLASLLAEELMDGRVANFGQRRREWGDEEEFNYGRPVNTVKAHHFDLRLAIITFGDCSCFDRRERVYGLLGAATKDSDKSTFPVNYGQNVIGLFFDTVDHNLFLVLSVSFARTLSRHLNLRPYVCSGDPGRLYATVRNSIPAKFREASFTVGVRHPCEVYGLIKPSEVAGLADDDNQETSAASCMSIWSLRTRGKNNPGGQFGQVCFTLAKAKPGDVVLGIDSSHCAMLARKSTLKGCFPILATPDYRFVGRCVLTHPTEAGKFSMQYAKQFLGKGLP